jgi:glycosyltransferase involved in cell wall biosynthesis
MRIAIVHDYLTQAGGAERVVESLHEIWPDAPIYTSVYDPPSTFAAFADMDIRTSFLQRFAWARRDRYHKYALPLYPLAFEMLDLRGYDVVLSHTTSFAKGVITSPETCHICYCHTPSRFAWRYHEYIAQGNYNRFMRRVLPFLIHHLRQWDVLAAQRVDYFLANSYNISRRILKYYGRESKVIHPPVETRRFHIESEPLGDYLLVASRLLPYKRVDLAIQAANQLQMPLKIAGVGPELERLRAMAGPTVEFLGLLGRQKDGKLETLIANCKAFLFPGEEDFGIAPLEAMAAGRPVIAYKAGGALETVAEGKTGLYFDEPTAESLVDAIQRLEEMPIHPQAIRQHAERFDTRVFQEEIRRTVEDRWREHQARYGRIAPGK